MADERIERFGNDETYRESIIGLSQLMDKVDIDEPSTNVPSQDITTNELLELKAENQASTLTEILEFMKSMVTLSERPDTMLLVGDNPGDKFTVVAQKDYLEKIAKKNYPNKDDPTTALTKRCESHWIIRRQVQRPDLYHPTQYNNGSNKHHQ